MGFVVGEVNMRGFNLGIGAVLFVGLGVGLVARKADDRRTWRSDRTVLPCLHREHGGDGQRALIRRQSGRWRWF